MNPLQAAVQTLQSEAEALAALAKRLEGDAAFAAVVELVRACKGRVVVTGVGKSGHIGGKIAATLASTGTPAFFVHPTEALHGDLGMITPADVLLALSHSGESKELSAILAYATRFGIPLVALTGQKSVEGGSTLVKAATYVLNTGVEREACPLGLAPTTSTTAALALADALAVALMTARGFGKQDFAVFHPGGKLGAQLLRVAEVMVKEDLPLLAQTAPMGEVLVALTQYNLGCVGFTDGAGNLVGIFTDGDLKRRLLAAPQGNIMELTAQQVMTPSPKTVEAQTMATAAVGQMGAQRVGSLWVVEGSRPVGLLNLADCVRAGVV